LHDASLVGHIGAVCRVNAYDTRPGENVTEEWLAERFQEQRPQLRAVAYRILGSLSESDDALQEAWLRVGRSDASRVENLGGWLTAIVSRVALNMLRARKTRREVALEGRLPDPVVSADERLDPEQEALIADSVGLALLAVLETLSPAERLAFVLHDMFAVPFDEIAPIVDRSPEAARQLASRARRRVRGATTAPDADLDTQRKVVDAFLAAAREGNFEALLEVLDPDVVLRADEGAPPVGAARVVRGAATVARLAMGYSRPDLEVRPALVNGAVGIVTLRDGKPFAISGFTIRNLRIVEMDVLADPERLSRLDLPIL
jgi:RNA polymerase sigma factor (sigma-70 family)